MSSEEESARGLYFDARRMQPESNQFVCWLDIMGLRNIQERSLSIAANFVMKLHIACLESNSPERVQLFPMNDGVYVCAEELVTMVLYLKDVFVKLARLFTEESQPLYRFLVKGGLSYGPVIAGDDCLDCSEVLSEHEDYCKRILLGIAMAQAFNREKEAPPFGLVMDESVRAFGRLGRAPISGLYWKWWRWNQTDDDVELTRSLRDELGKYYDWCTKLSSTIGYDPDRISRHRKLVDEYFEDEREWGRATAAG
jgi:hypothetical protein